ncbi:hypothetical protein CF65_02799 [Aggregatibacter actinomycetemcomitans HK1651]|nr:hypothetical protein CF65_02799 [Aggregatibacter actinomycetemcomitans HK1651]
MLLKQKFHFCDIDQIFPNLCFILQDQVNSLLNLGELNIEKKI